LVTFFEALRGREAPQEEPLAMRGVVAGAKAYLLARLFVEQRRSLLIITPDDRQRDLLYDDLRCFLADVHTVMEENRAPRECVYRYHTHPSGQSEAIEAQQQRALLTYQPLWRLLAAEPIVVVAAVTALGYGVLPPAALQQHLVSIQVGAFCALDTLLATLTESGYRRVPMVEGVGEFSVRGGILDLFSPGEAHPWRIEFFGDEIETIRTFDVASQVSVAAVSQVTVAPMHPLSPNCLERPDSIERLRTYLHAHGCSAEQSAAYLEALRRHHPAAWPWGAEGFFYDTVQSPLGYLPASALLCCVDMEDTLLTLHQTSEGYELEVGGTSVPLPPDHFIPASEVARQVRMRTHLAFMQYDPPPETPAVRTLQTRSAPQFFGGLDRFIGRLRQWQADGYCVLILCRFALEAQRIQELLAAYDIGSRAVPTPAACLSDETIEPGTVLLGVGELSQGCVLPEMHLIVLRTVEILGEKKPAETATSSRTPATRRGLDVLQAGDRVVHVDYGIGIYRRMTFLDIEQDGGEFMEVEYADGAKLYVPSYRLSVVQKYTGGEGSNGQLDRLSGSTWARTKARVKTSLLAMAEDLVKVHAARQTRSGYGFSHPTAMHRDFEASFEYTETEDQLRAIQQVMEDMERPTPMERLVCGDVGYGKTEVAMRAAFKAVYDGKQVAILVPTTVLAQQHYDTFRSRFAAYPVEIGMLSRMRRRKEQQQLLEKLRHGTVDIIIGTHRLLQKDVRFKALGLLVVDEEHRFGVAHKERIKRLSTDIDVLMLTATPIPRSLHMALIGLRQFSIIETPPEGRSPIQTRVLPFDDETLQRAIRQEQARGGQVFFVHNHIDTLPAIKQLLTRLVPECRIGIAHGQMSERQLEKIMCQFLERQFDLLLCTTIIESGLDIPSVNTIIIDRADRFGLAQLYQLRGRVGRRAQQAYAYLLVPGDLVLSTTARKRLEAIEEFNALGSSFQLASRDLEIRGAGNLLGPQQSGYIASVGYRLYCQMLEEAVRTARGEDVPIRVEPELRLEVQGYIPQEYIDSEAQRLELYQRLAAVEHMDALKALAQEFRDRFGVLPVVTQRLLAVVEIKILARQLGLERIEQRREAVILTFHAQTPVQPDQLLGWLHARGRGFHFESERQVRFALDGETIEARFGHLKKHLQQLLQIVGE
jgi:transcription-repair coupling factor (superfamily II helicase)